MMLSFFIRRLISVVPTLAFLIVISFTLIKLAPGGPFTSERPLPPEVLANIQAKYNLDQPFYIQLWSYTKSIVLDFDLGPSFVYKDLTVNQLIADAFPITLKYGFFSFLVAVIFGLLLGFTAAVFRNSWLDYLSVGLSIGAQVLPNFIVAPVLVLLFTLYLGWLPGGGWGEGSWEYVVMPVIALSTSYIASVARISRSSMIEVLHSNHIRTATAKGLSSFRILFFHALKPALLPVLSFLGPAFVTMITGSVLVDIYFSTGGLGVHFVNSALNRDYSVLLGITILFGALIILFNFIVDVLYVWIDPKLRT